MTVLVLGDQARTARDLPEVYWTGETDLACLADGGVRERGYTHHIERLMVPSNFALTDGVDPGASNDWFHAGVVDAFHWVTTPNVVGMGVYGSDALATKPYAASANYLDRLYWDFLAEHEEALSNHRMGLVYSHLDDKRDARDLDAIRARAETVRERVGSRQAPW